MKYFLHVMSYLSGYEVLLFNLVLLLSLYDIELMVNNVKEMKSINLIYNLVYLTQENVVVLLNCEVIKIVVIEGNVWIP